jgi:hypothetical protein
MERVADFAIPAEPVQSRIRNDVHDVEFDCHGVEIGTASERTPYEV